jgi:serine protease Do
MGYAISIKEAKPVIDQLIKNGYVIRPYLGAELYTVDQFVIFRYRLPLDKGVFVTEVASGSPADKAGIKPGDVITAVGDKAVSSAGELVRILQSHEVGQQIRVTFYHGSVKNTVTATLTQTPPP